MINSFEDILDLCINRIMQGEALDEVVKDYPEHKEQLEQLLVIMTDMYDSTLPQIRDEAFASTLINVGKELQRQKEQFSDDVEESPSFKWRWFFNFPSPAWQRGVVFALVLIFVSWGTVNISAASFPGDILYPIKIVTEKVRFYLTPNSEGKAELRLTFSEERTQELVQYFEENGELDTQLIQAMLNEAALAVHDISKLPKPQRTVYVSKLQHLNAYNKDILENFRDKAPQHQKQALEKAIETCGSRMKWMDDMKYERVPPNEWCSWNH